MRTALILSLVSTALPAVAVAQQAEWDDQAVAQAVARAKAFLWSGWSEGHWPEQGQPGAREGTGYAVNHGGVTALCAFALLSAGEDSQQPRMKRTLDWLAGVEMNGTYARAMRACALATLGRNSPYHKRLTEDVDWLVKAADPRGAYDYHPSPVRPGTDPKALRFDNSNSHLAALGVWMGAQNGVNVPAEYWKRVERHWRDVQRGDGGWTYQERGPGSYGSMTAAGLATLLVCFDRLYGDQFVACRENTEYEPLARGMEWLNANFSAQENPGRGPQQYFYYLFGLERVGLAGGQKYFGGKDWYKAGATALVGRQNANGGWGELTDSAFALLFLARGQQPVLINKLRYQGTWNCRPRDCAHLTAWISETFERPVNWQIIDASAPVSTWHDAPVLYVSGATAPEFSDQDIERLRQFVLQGGTIFSEAAGNRSDFTLAMQRYYAKAFPDYPLSRLPDDHPLYSLHFNIQKPRGLSAVSNGVRLLAVHSPSEVSLAWQLNDTQDGSDLFRLAANIYFHVTDRGSLRGRGVSPWPVRREFEPRRAGVRLAVVRHGGNWNPEPLAWQRFAILMGNECRVRVDLSDPLAAGDLDPDRWPAAAMTGTGTLALSEKEREGLKKYLAGGGTLIVDAAGGDAAFARSAEEQFADLLPGARFEMLPEDHPVYVWPAGAPGDGRPEGITRAGAPVRKCSFRRSLRTALARPDRPRLMGFIQDGRCVVFFSREDLTAGLVGYPCWGLEGYEPQSAFELMRNLVIYANASRAHQAPATTRTAAPE